MDWKLLNIGTTIFTEMSMLATAHNAVNLGQGFPDYDMSLELRELVSKAMMDGCNQYAHMAGYLPLREAIAEKAGMLYGANLNPNDEITITPGGTYAIYTALTTILNPGDEVIIFEPAYDSYVPAIELCGAVAVPVALDLPGYSVPWTTVAEKINNRTKAIVINSPHNPSGAVLEEKDIEALRALTADKEIFIISDEVYEHLIFDGKQHLSMLKYPDLFAKSFVCFSVGKTYHCTGWKMGYCIAPVSLMKQYRKVHQYNAFCCFTPAQVALAAFLKEKEAYLQLSGFMQQKRDYFLQGMSSTAFKPIPSFGSYFQLYNYEGVNNDLNEKEFAVWLTKEAGVTTIPVSSFYINPSANNNKVVRFCFAKKQETLDAALERLTKFSNKS